MPLSSDLVSQFVKITKDNKRTKTETTVYGTIVDYSDSKYVRLDGSDLLTPVTMTVDAKAGERVTVRLKNHTATVTGNITSPAARVETVKVVVDSVTDVENILANTVITQASALPTSGTALTANTIYLPTTTVKTYAFKPPTSSGWAHGKFTAGTSPNITFSGTIIGKLPTFEANKKYEFDVYNGKWIVQEVVTQ